MNPPNKKALGPRGIPQPFAQRNGLVHRFKPPVAQVKNAVSARRPVAPPVYRPQPVPRVLQTRKDHLRAGTMHVKVEFKSPASPSKIGKPVVQAKQITRPVTSRTLPVRPLVPVAHVPHATRIPVQLPGGRIIVGRQNAVVQRSLKTRAQAAKEKAAEEGSEEKKVSDVGEATPAAPKKAKVWSPGEEALAGFKYEAEKKPRWTEDESVTNLGEEGACTATISGAGKSCTAYYDGGEGFHAEMAALNEYLKTNKVEEIERIAISSAPCRVCRAILNNLGLKDKVRVPVGHKKKTGSNKGCRIPENVLKVLCDKFPWERVREYLSL